MDKEILRSVLVDYQIEIPRHKVIPRNFQIEEFGNYVFVGIRRAGKSYLLYQRILQLLAAGTGWDEILYINFEDRCPSRANQMPNSCRPDAHLVIRVK